MNRTALSCLAAVALSGAVGVVFHSVASAEDCYGLNAARVCATPQPQNFPTVDPSGGQINECIHVGPTCAPVVAPKPSASVGSGAPVVIGCYIGQNPCYHTVNEIVATSAVN